MDYQGFSLLEDSAASCPAVCLTLPPRRLAFADLQQFESLLEQAEDQNPQALLVLRGADGFCPGLSFEELRSHQENAERMISLAEKTLRHLAKLANPKLAVLYGESRGWGATLAINCDFCLMQRQAQMVWDDLAHGLTPGSASWSLPQLVGMGWARDILLSGRPVRAEEAQKLGLAHGLFDSDEEASQQIRAVADLVKQLSPCAFQATRKLLREAGGSSYTNFLGVGLASQAMCLPCVTP